MEEKNFYIIDWVHNSFEDEYSVEYEDNIDKSIKELIHIDLNIMEIKYENGKNIYEVDKYISFVFSYQYDNLILDYCNFSNGLKENQILNFKEIKNTIENKLNEYLFELKF